MLPSLNTLLSAQSKPASSSNQDITRFFYYTDTHPNATIRYHRSNMVLHIYSDTYFFVNLMIKVQKDIFFSVINHSTQSIFHHCKTSVLIRETLQGIGYCQAPTPIQTYNTIVVGFATSTIKHKRAKVMDMNFH